MILTGFDKFDRYVNGRLTPGLYAFQDCYNFTDDIIMNITNTNKVLIFKNDVNDIYDKISKVLQFNLNNNRENIRSITNINLFDLEFKTLSGIKRIILAHKKLYEKYYTKEFVVFIEKSDIYFDILKLRDFAIQYDLIIFYKGAEIEFDNIYDLYIEITKKGNTYLLDCKRQRHGITFKINYGINEYNKFYEIT